MAILEPSSTLKRVLLRHLQNVARGLHTLDHILRGRQAHRFSPDDTGDTDSPATTSSLMATASCVLVGGLIYGLAMGSYAGIAGERPWEQQWLQMAYSGIKVPLLVAMTLVVSLPSFFVINTLFGLRQEFGEALRAILAAQAGLVLILVSLMPLTLFAYLSLATIPGGYSKSVIFNAAMFGIASISAQVLLKEHYRRLILSNQKHRHMVRLWILVYAFVGIQASYVLRPFIGSPRAEISFFRNEPFENAYVVILKLVWHLFSGSAVL